MVFKNATTIVLNKSIEKRFTKMPMDVLYHIFDYIEERDVTPYYLTFEGIVVPLYPKLLKSLLNRIENPAEIKKVGVSFTKNGRYSTSEYLSYRINEFTLYFESILRPTDYIIFRPKGTKYYYRGGTVSVNLENYFRTEDDEYDIESEIMVFDVKHHGYGGIDGLEPTLDL